MATDPPRVVFGASDVMYSAGPQDGSRMTSPVTAAGPVEHDDLDAANAEDIQLNPSKDVHNGELPVAGTESEIDPSDNLPCKWGPFSPSYLQRFRSPKMVLLCLCLAGAFQGMVVNGFVSVVISTIERRFDFSSTESGFIVSSYDFAGVLALLPVTYIGGMGSKPRWLGMGIFIVGLGSMLFSLPHFTTGLYRYVSPSEASHCTLTPYANHTVCRADEEDSTQLNSYKYILIFAQLLHGAGASPIYTLGVTYLDDNLKPKVLPMYTSVFYFMAIVGPAIGYLVGGELLKYYTDIVWLDPAEVTITPKSPRWVGAWWIGFLVSGIFAIVVAVPISGFPRSLPGTAKVRRNRVSEAYSSGSARLRAQKISEAYKGSDVATSKPGFGQSLKDIPQSLLILLTNPTFMFLNLAGASEGLLLSGFTAFAPKFLESQFSLSAGIAAQFVGFAIIPSGGCGTFLGGYVIKKWNLKCGPILKFCMATTFTSLIMTMSFLVQCPNPRFAGVNVDYIKHNTSIADANLTSVCNSNCHCTQNTQYDPICGVDGLTYFSPCHAGCLNATIRSSETLFYNCTCVGPSRDPQQVTYHAQHGKCDSDCQLLYFFLPAFSMVIFFTFFTCMPALSATLRCVSEKQRSFALGIQWILVRCLGTIPAPIFFGFLIDKTCLLWQKTCGDEKGACYVYDNQTMSNYILSVAVCGKGLSLTFMALALWLYKPPPAQAKLAAEPGEQLSASSTIVVLNRDSHSLDSRTSCTTLSVSTARASPNRTSPLLGKPPPLHAGSIPEEADDSVKLTTAAM